MRKPAPGKGSKSQTPKGDYLAAMGFQRWRPLDPISEARNMDIVPSKCCFDGMPSDKTTFKRILHLDNPINKSAFKGLSLFLDDFRIDTLQKPIPPEKR